MKTRLAIAFAVIVMIQMLFTTTVPGQSKMKLAFAAQDNGPYTPPAGSAERKAIMDTYRQVWKGQGTDASRDVVFVVNNLKVKNGWAWLDVNPQSPDGVQQYEAEQALLRKRSGRWRVVERIRVRGVLIYRNGEGKPSMICSHHLLKEPLYRMNIAFCREHEFYSIALFVQGAVEVFPLRADFLM